MSIADDLTDPGAGPRHSVQFYADEASLVDSVARFAGTGLKHGRSVVLIATGPHLDGIRERLGAVFAEAEADGRLVCRDAAATLADILVDGWPSSEVFLRIVGGLVHEAAGQSERVLAFGEMVALLCERGQYGAAVRLEGLWNELAGREPLSLLCAYPASLFGDAMHGAEFAEICSAHTHVHATDEYLKLADDERRRMVAMLQQRTIALESEIRERKELERKLALRERELLDFLENAVEPLHNVDAAGNVLWANKAELDLLGYAPEEYIGHHFGEFHADPALAEDCLRRLVDGETLRDFPVRMKCRDGSIRDVLLSSNAYWVDGAFAYSRCFTRDVTTSATRERSLRDLNETLEQRVAERTDALHRSEVQLRQLIAGIEDYAIFMLDADGYVETWNPGAERIKGYTADEIIGRHYSTFYTPEDRAEGKPERALATAVELGKFEAEAWRVRKDGSRFLANVLLDAIHDENGKLIGFAKVTRDMTKRRAIEEQLRQSQKIEAVGQLTGGVAHDFNNLLTVIIGNLEIIWRQAPSDPKLRHAAEQALRGAQRAATLTQQLLAFSRRQPLSPKPVDVNRLVAGMSDLLRRTLAENIAIETVLAGGLWRTEVDPHQLESALLNLAVNARDAMPEGGKLTIETANAHLDSAYSAEFAELTPGQYVAICVTDTGTGMTGDVMRQAFEPFFTTKPVGQGTGLGLSQVYGFVKQSGGHVKLYSEPGDGTTVKIYLRRLVGDVADAAPEPVPAPIGGSETVLVVEDDDDVRLYSAESLRELGFNVVEAADGPAALRVLEERSDIDLLFTDIGLPGLNGRQVVEEARKRRPGLRVLFTTGYARNAIVHQGRLDEGVELLGKPFNRAQLAKRVRDVLDAPLRRLDGVPHALIVEDEPLMRDLAAHLLREAGFDVVKAESVAQALDVVRSHPPFDMALIDIGLRDRSGLDLVAELRVLWPALPIVVASGYDSHFAAAVLRKDEHTLLLQKPFDTQALVAALGKLGVGRGQRRNPRG